MQPKGPYSWYMQKQQPRSSTLYSVPKIQRDKAIPVFKRDKHSDKSLNCRKTKSSKVKEQSMKTWGMVNSALNLGERQETWPKYVTTEA